METVYSRINSVFLAVLSAATIGLAVQARAAETPSCADVIKQAPPTIVAAYNQAHYSAAYKERFGDNKDPESPAAKKADAGAIEDANTIALGDIVTIRGNNIAGMFGEACATRTVVLFLNGRPMKGVVLDPPTDTSQNRVHFKLKRTDKSEAAWTEILGSPLTRSHEVEVSLGFEDGYALKSTNPKLTTLTFAVVPKWPFLLWLLFFIGLLLVFGYYTVCTNIIRDPGPVSATSLGLFSLSRLQGAWWFFVIVAAYLFIGIITQDFSDSINSTALILLGIGAGTVVGSAAIDARNDNDTQKAQTTAAIAAVKKQIDDANAALAKVETDLKANSKDAAMLAEKAAQKKTKRRL